jgi:cysteine sulfinate desulfinase/cysteine desulfurase-like protein
MTLYFNYNATTPIDPQVVSTITETLKEAWANPSSASRAGNDNGIMETTITLIILIKAIKQNK